MTLTKTRAIAKIGMLMKMSVRLVLGMVIFEITSTMTTTTSS